MNRTQRVILALYFLLVAYCCVWIPWHVRGEPDYSIRAGYGWAWVGPSERASPDVAVIVLRLMAVTAIGATAFTVASIKR